MNHVAFFFCTILLSASVAAQSSLTVGYAGNVYFYNGINARYAQQANRLETSLYGTVATGGGIKVDEFSSSSIIGIMGFSLNRMPELKNGAGMYYGLSVEGLVHSYIAQNTGKGYTDYSVLAGPQVGWLARLTDRIYLNADWGLRIGTTFGRDYKLIFTGNNVSGGFYKDDNYFFAYMPTSIGLRFRLGGKVAKAANNLQDPER